MCARLAHRPRVTIDNGSARLFAAAFGGGPATASNCATSKEPFLRPEPDRSTAAAPGRCNDRRRGDRRQPALSILQPFELRSRSFPEAPMLEPVNNVLGNET